jgi:pilus assembly protein CpaC
MTRGARRPANWGIKEMLASLLRKLGVATVALAAFAAFFAGQVPARADEPEGFAAAAAAPQAVNRTVKLGLNKALVVDLPRDARDVLISNPAIADAVMRTPRRIYLTGVAIGQASIIVFDRAGQQIVTLDLEVERDNSTLQRMLQRLIPDSDITVEMVSDNIVLSGSVRTPADSRKAQDIANIFANGGANVQPASSGSSGGDGGSGAVSISLNTTASAPPTSSVVNLLAVEGEDQVHLKVTVAEVQRNIAKQLGVNISGVLDSGNFVSSILTDNPFAVANKALSDTKVTAGYFDNGTSNLTGTLRALDQTGMIKTLAEPTLTAISGESASFLAGGEFPVPTGQDQNGNITIEFKPFGVQLGFTPVVLSEGRISLRVKTEVSELTSDGAFTLNSANGNNLTIPGLKVRRSETTMELPSGGSMVMGGLLEDDVRQTISAFPGLGKLPVLGALFRSRDFQRKETELVIIVTPYLVKPVARTALAKPDDGFAPAGDGPANFLGRLNRVYGIEGKPAPAGAYRGTYGFIYE